MTPTHWLAAALLLEATTASAETIPVIDRTTTTEQVALGRASDDRMTVAVSVSGKGPYRFLVDTGSERTVISRELADRLRLASGRQTVLHSVLGSKDVATVFIPDLRISSRNIFSVVDAPALGASDIGADGMLGVDSLRSQRVLFDFKAGSMSISPASKPAEQLDGETIVVRAQSRGGRLIFTQARLAGRKVTVIVDTGSQVTVGNMALQRMLTKRGQLQVPELIMVESVTGERMEAQVAQLDKLEIGGVRFGELAIAFADAHIFDKLGLDGKPALLLGMNAMRAFDQVSIDFASKKVRFVLPSTSMREPVRLAAAGGV